MLTVRPNCVTHQKAQMLQGEIGCSVDVVYEPTGRAYQYIDFT